MIPLFPGHLSALGQILADQRHDFVRSWGGKIGNIDVNDLKAVLETMRVEGGEALQADGFKSADITHEYSADMRYVGQSFTLNVPIAAQLGSWSQLKAVFAQRHLESYGYIDERSEMEIVSVRSVSIGAVDKPTIRPTLMKDKKIVGASSAWFGGVRYNVPIINRYALAMGEQIAGPVIVEEAGGTTVVPPRWRIAVDEAGNLSATIDAVGSHDSDHVERPLESAPRS